MQPEQVIHTILDSEKNAFTNHVNEVLQEDPDVKNKIPIPTGEIFDAVQDGVILCKLINCAVPGKVPPISPMAINLTPSTTYHKIENLNLAIESAKSIGCIVINVRPEFIMEKREHIVLGMIWQIIRIHINNQLTIKRHPELIVLKKEDEEDDVMQKLGYEEILIRWLNYHIKKNGGNREVKNLGNDLADSEAYGHVFSNISHVEKEFWEKSKEERAKDIITCCKKEKIKTTVNSQDIVSGNTKLNTLLCVNIFNEKHGLEQEKVVELPPEPETDQTREMRVFKNWINSQGIEDVYVNYLIDDLRNGRILLKVIDRLRPNSVDWKNHYSDKLHSRIHIIQNCKNAVEISQKNMDVKLVGIGGIDIVDGNVNLTLGLVWQLCKVYWEERVGKIDQKALLAWGNERVPPEHQIKSFKDPALQNCQFLAHIIESIKAKTLDFEKFKEPNSDENIIANINYTIASARKLGAEIIALWEHIKESNSRYVSLMVAQLQRVSKK